MVQINLNAETIAYGLAIDAARQSVMNMIDTMAAQATQAAAHYNSNIAAETVDEMQAAAVVDVMQTTNLFQERIMKYGMWSAPQGPKRRAFLDSTNNTGWSALTVPRTGFLAQSYPNSSIAAETVGAVVGNPNRTVADYLEAEQEEISLTDLILRNM